MWQVSQTVCPAWMALLGLSAAWQVAHCVLTATLAWNLAGVQAVKPALWQASQLALAVVDTNW